ncbi:aminotransferase class I/II-fold pyridoxal phosphate-dependent enzyme [Sporolactobacillus nakayamae]|uniref:Cystathionine beta-lyase family protein involved in aluminum resistance n=1 Tax=Sporolactobacillus nakayamae TaxID=269670 RepID=A0A1I2N8Y1_9BACL|nr:methionine gamma-lyase family protein [Sporolactobacillus nakayamae]SFF99580.1 Cystathionine beta-lyase family protein involved in aluminum resistance [Sporolactobacillus nakayamae]
MFDALTFGKELISISAAVEAQIAEQLKAVDAIALENQYRVLSSFKKNKISDAHFNGSTGYGYDDFGREGIESVYADCFGAESALVRSQMISGTHAITTALFGVLRPGDELMYITGKPYDTLEGVIGLSGNSHGSLKDFGIQFRSVPLRQGRIDTQAVIDAIAPNTKMIGIQRSCGYANRPSIAISQIGEAISSIKKAHPDVVIFVDNCYGEFTETREPCHVGADLMAGSLIKNPGGGLAKVGGYIVGREALVSLCAERLTAPGLGKEVGPSLGELKDQYQGFFLSPHTVAQAVKGAVFTSALMEKLGMETSPSWEKMRTDLIQRVTFHDPDQMIAFCQAIQMASPINAHVQPYPSPMPGYTSDVIMAAGTFIQGASLELTADGPIRPPYTLYVQGGLTFEHVKAALMIAVNHLMEKELLDHDLIKL